MDDLETLLYEENDGVAWVTLNRPEVHNAFNAQMQRELSALWRGLRHNDDVRCVVLTGAGEKAFCTGIDRMEQMGGEDPTTSPTTTIVGSGVDAVHVRRPRRQHRPEENDLWKPVIAAVNGMACGGAFYMLGEVEFIIAADHATFFDPHVTYGMTAGVRADPHAPTCRSARSCASSLLGNHERMSAARAHEIGLVSEVVPAEELMERAMWVATPSPRSRRWRCRARCGRSGRPARTADRRSLCGHRATRTSRWTSQESIAEGQERLSSGSSRELETLLTTNERRSPSSPAIRPVRLHALTGRWRAAYEAMSGCRRRRADQSRHRRPRRQRQGPDLHRFRSDRADGGGETEPRRPEDEAGRHHAVHVQRPGRQPGPKQNDLWKPDRGCERDGLRRGLLPAGRD